MKDGQPLMEFGNMNGSIQAIRTTHLINMIDLGFNPQASADAARYTHSQSSTGPDGFAREQPACSSARACRRWGIR
jgi:gamma-glutamyltranspeptidase/glutathione hydrolase